MKYITIDPHTLGPITPPARSCPPNKARLNEWAASQTTPKLVSIAQTIATHIQYISYPRFVAQLQRTCAEFNRLIDQEQYIILLLKHPDEQHTECSDVWVTRHALDYLTHKPQAILQVHPREDSNDKLYYLVGDVKNILILDDAAYSGEQKQRYWQYIAEQEDYPQRSFFKDKHLFMGLPFISHRALERFARCIAPQFAEYTVLPHTIIRLLQEHITQEQRVYLKCYPSFENLLSKSLCYFDHCFPDQLSTIDVFYTGQLLFPHEHVPDFLELILGDKHFPLLFLPNRYNRLCFDYRLMTPYPLRPGYTIPLVKRPYNRHDLTRTEAVDIKGYPLSQLDTKKQECWDTAVLNGLLQMTYQDYWKQATRLSRNNFFAPSTRTKCVITFIVLQMAIVWFFTNRPEAVNSVHGKPSMP
jgi:hypothetical protein